MATTFVCSKAGLNLGGLTQGVQGDPACRKGSCIASCSSRKSAQGRGLLKQGADGVTNAEALGSCNGYYGSAKRWKAVSLQLQTRRECATRMRVSASKDVTEEVTFEWKGEAADVQLVGSFLDWIEKVPLEKVEEGVYRVTYALPPGTHQYKFLVDGEWKHQSGVETVADGVGGVNNQIVIKEKGTKKSTTKKDPKAEKKQAQEAAKDLAREKKRGATDAAEQGPPTEGEGPRSPEQPATPTPQELQAIAEKAPPPGEKPEPIEETVAKAMGKPVEKKAKEEEKPAEKPKPAPKPAAKAAEPAPKKVEAKAAPVAEAPKPEAKAAAAKPVAAKPAAKTDAPAVAEAKAPAVAEEKPKPAAAPKAKAADNGAPSADATPTPKAKPASKAKAGKKAGKAPAKPLNELMSEDVVPLLTTTLEKENVSDIELVWENNELRGCFVNGGVPYCFWAFFPDGKLEGSRGFSVTSHGYPPSTIEPFFVDERPQGMTAELMVFWIKKRLFAQKSALPKLN